MVGWLCEVWGTLILQYGMEKERAFGPELVIIGGEIDNTACGGEGTG